MRWGEEYALMEFLDAKQRLDKFQKFLDVEQSVDKFLEDCTLIVQLLMSMNLRSIDLPVQIFTDPDADFSQLFLQDPRLRGGRSWLQCARSTRNLRDFFEQRLLFGGINFDPLFAKFVLYPLAGTIFVSLAELLVVGPLSRVVILSQLGSDADEDVRGGGGGGGHNKVMLRRRLVSFAHRFGFFGIGSLAGLCFQNLLMSRLPTMSLGLAALTYSLFFLLDPLENSTTRKPNENYLRTLCARLPKSVLDIFPSMTISFLAFEALVSVSESISQVTMPVGTRIMLSLTCGGLVSLLTEIFGELSQYKVLWRGSLVSLAHRLTFFGVNYLAYLNFNTLLTNIALILSIPLPTVALVSGGLATSTATLISYPLDTLRTHIAVKTSEEYRGAWRAYRDICKDGGFQSLYAGISTSLLGIFPSMAINILVFETASLFWGVPRPDKSSTMFDLACGTTASIIASSVTFPVEVVQRRRQMEEAERRRSKRKSLGFRKTLAMIVEKEGIEGLYRGIRPHITKVVLGYAVAFMAYEMVKIPCCWLNLNYFRSSSGSMPVD